MPSADRPATPAVPRRRILLIVGAFPKAVSPDSGGGVLASCSALLDAGIGELFDLRLVDTTQRIFPTPSAPVRLLWSLPRIMRFFVALLKRPAPDGALIFLSEGLSFIEKSLLAVCAKAMGLTVAIAPRGGGVRRELAQSAAMRTVARLTMRRVDHVICQGESWVSFFAQFLDPPEPDRTRLISLLNWTATAEMLTIGQERLGQEQRDDGLRVLFFGWIIREKGIVEMIEAFAIAAQRVPGLQLTIAGTGAFESEARALCQAKTVAGSVVFSGWLHGAAKLDALREADCLCLPSWSEGMPNAVIEAMACALPCVVTPVGGVPDAAPAEAVAIHVPVKDPQALADAFERLARDRALRRRLSIQAFERARTHFTATHALAVFGRIFGALPQQRDRPVR